MTLPFEPKYVHPNGHLTITGWQLLNDMSVSLTAAQAALADAQLALSKISPFFVDLTYTSGQVIPADTRTLIDFAPTLRRTNAPDAYADHDFFNNDRFMPIPSGADGMYEVRLYLSVTANVIDTDITLDLDIGGGFGAIEFDQALISEAATATNTTARFDFYTGPTFRANGGAFHITATNPVTINSVDAKVTVERIA